MLIKPKIESFYMVFFMLWCLL